MAVTRDPRNRGKNTRNKGRRRNPDRHRDLHATPVRAPATVYSVEIDPNVQITPDTHIACLSLVCYLEKDDEKPKMLRVLLTPIQLARLQNQIAGVILSQVHTGATILTTMAKKKEAHRKNEAIDVKMELRDDKRKATLKEEEGLDSPQPR